MINVSIFGYYGQKNAGDEAILSSLLSGLKAMTPACDCTVFSGDPSDTEKTHGVRSRRSVVPTNLRNLAVRSLGRQRRAFFSAFFQYIRTDVVLVGGGGLFIDKKDTNQHLIGYLRRIRQAKKLGKTVGVVGVSVGPIHHKESEEILGSTLDSVDAISVRDTESKRILQRCGVTTPEIKVFPDLAFGINPGPAARIEEISRTESLGDSGREVLAVVPCSYNQRTPGWLDAYVDFCVHAIDVLKVEVWLVPMQTADGLDDRVCARAIAERVGRNAFLRCINGSYGPREIFGILSRADAVLAERLHGAIMAVAAAVPVFAIGYMPKVTRLFAELGHPEWCLDMRELDSRRLIEGFQRLFTSRKPVGSELRYHSVRLREASAGHYDVINDLIRFRMGCRT